MERKREIRQRMQRARLAMQKQEWMEKSRAICERLIAHPLFLHANGILVYMDMKNEVCTKQIIRAAWEQNKKVGIPKVQGKRMEFYEICSFNETAPGTFGVCEPTAGKQIFSEGMLMVMPGVAFDRKKNRIGYGAGYYDAYLKAHPDMPKAALAFEFQVLREVPAEEHDIRPDILITESTIY
ncbi:5-formyltetrahydrofolate cyclo-ligase [Lachnoclostridium sp. An181]|uniref:5-formyltetrahydrofolate cyclo-ligase n=1 Tax=Lachnoclostridium sp. An181 TaxID=1965575 RepID=UPI000B39AE49|nr:5-formyltetrahydrofolate cyclo-ligase [Lachnoclostridium sp. An181]OUP50872.1 5-formyltetrahydrofolate cyclo-ligase [Lachnoclostridium sp. An181]